MPEATLSVNSFHLFKFTAELSIGSEEKLADSTGQRMIGEPGWRFSSIDIQTSGANHFFASSAFKLVLKAASFSLDPFFSFYYKHILENNDSTKITFITRTTPIPLSAFQDNIQHTRPPN